MNYHHHKKLVDEILKNTSTEDILDMDTHNINIEDLLKGSSNSPMQNYSYGFHPSSMDYTSSSTSFPIQDDDLSRILREAEKVYGKHDSSEDNISYSNYIESLDLGGGISGVQGKKEAEEVLPYKTPIEFVNYMETVYIKSKLEGNENVFQLKNYKQHAKIKFTVLDFLKKSTLNQKFYKGSNMVTSIAALDDVIFAGNNLGVIRLYSCEREQEYKSYTLKEIGTCSKRSVVCMDVTPDGDYMISGYSNGYIALWDLHTTYCKKLVTNAHKSSVLACQFIRNDKKKFEFLSSDLDGNVMKVIIKEGLFSVGVEIIPVFTSNAPVFIIKILKFTETEKKMYEFCRTNSLIVAFASLEQIIVQMIEPESKRIFKLERPIYLKDSIVPDLSYGIGYIPNFTDNNVQEDGQLVEESGKVLDYSKAYIIISISWGKVIYIYTLPILNNIIYQMSLAGHYINSSVIIRMGFLANSIIFFFDKQKFIKVINTSLVTPGDVRLGVDGNLLPSTESTWKRPELEDGRVVDPDLLFQTYLPDTLEATPKATYNNFIINIPKNIYVLAKREFYHGTLLNWEQCLNNLHQNSEWMDALTLGLDIYHGRTTALADIPIDEFIRKTKVGHFLKGLIHQFAIIHTGNDRGNMLTSPSTSEKEFQERLSRCIHICIEFCIEIDAVDYLLTQLQPIFDSKGFGDEFIQKLEPFILCDKIINQQLGQMTISTIIDLYIKKKKYHLLSQMLIHLDIQSIDIDYVKHICSEYNLVTPLIYICMNGVDEDYFYPLKRIFEIFEKAKEIPKSYFISYANCLKKMSTADLEMSKQYLGHKLLWYANLALNGKKFPGNTNMSEKKYRKLLVRITLWLLSDEVFPVLLNFDSFSFFVIMTRIFHDEKCIEILSNHEYDSYTSLGLNITGPVGVPLSDIQPPTLIDHIVFKSKEAAKPGILQDMYEFIAKVGGDLKLEKQIVIDAIRYLLTYKFERDQQSNEDNDCGFRPQTYKENFNKYIDNMSNTILDLIDSRSDLDKNDIFTLLSASELSPFVLVKIHLLKLNKNYTRCIEVYLYPDNYITNREAKVFEWIDDTLAELNDKDLLNFESVKEEVLNRLHTLAELSIESVTKLVENWFSQEQDIVIHKLDKAQPLQLRYVENILERFKDDEDMSEEKDKKFDQYTALLKLHIKLLCKLNKKDQVLPNLKRRTAYPVDICLKKCLKHKVYDAAIYLYQSTGAFKDALNLAIEVMNTTFQNILGNLQSSLFKDDINTLLLEDHKKNLRQCIEICENNSDKTETKDSEEMWFIILKQLYSMLSTVKSNSAEVRKTYFDEMSKTISGDIKDILEKMCSYVSIQMIIENVTDNYKQAEFKEFKKLLLKMLSSYSHLKNILISAKNLLGNSVLYHGDELKKINQKGNRYELYNCDQCLKNFNHIADEPIFVFRCGHKVHIRCTHHEKDDVICVICRKNEIESSLSTGNLLVPRRSDVISAAGDGVDPLQELARKGKNDHLYSRLRAFDKHYIEKSSLLASKI